MAWDDDEEKLTRPEAAALLDRVFTARAKFNAAVAAAQAEREPVEKELTELRWVYVGSPNLDHPSYFGDDSADSLTITLPAASPHGEYGETLTLSRKEAVEYVSSPLAFAARRIGALPAEYLEWIEMRGLSYCGALAANNLACRQTVNGQCDSFAEWKTFHRQALCFHHAGSRLAQIASYGAHGMKETSHGWMRSMIKDGLIEKKEIDRWRSVVVLTDKGRRALARENSAISDP